MNLIKIGTAALNQTPLDWSGNTTRIINALKLAREEGLQFLALPELSLSGYGCEDSFFSPDTTDTALISLQKILPHSKGIITCIGLPLRFQSSIFNCMAVLYDGEWVGLIPKKSLANEGVHYESRWFREWPVGFSTQFNYEYQGKELTVPIGDIFFEWNNLRFGFEICEEAWVANRPGVRLASHSIDLIINPSASHFAFGKNEIRKRFIVEGSRAFSCVYAYSNLVGNESGRIVYDGSLFIASQGELMAESQRFTYNDTQLISAIVDINSNRNRRVQSPNFKLYTQNDGLTMVKLREAKNSTSDNQETPWVPSIPLKSSVDLTKNEEFLHAVSLALFDYLRKSKSQGFAISLSGGIDSSVVAVLASSALRMAAKELGLKELKQKLSFIKKIQSLEHIDEIIKFTVYSVYQSTQNSSTQTQNAASGLAQALNLNHFEWSIDSVKSMYEEIIEKALGQKLSWSKDDVALQNIQARVRSPGIWLLANIKGLLLLATSNRSEAAVGYATMDGDTSGGLSPLGGIDKAFLMEWIRWKSKDLPALSEVYRIPPTAELRPSTSLQTDEKDLMPYKVLDFIERHLLIDRIAGKDLYKLLLVEFTEHKPEELKHWLIRFLKLWTQNQWKRERLAPSFHLDSENLDPKTWCRFPILSSAYSKDIEELENSAK